MEIYIIRGPVGHKVPGPFATMVVGGVEGGGHLVGMGRLAVQGPADRAARGPLIADTIMHQRWVKCVYACTCICPPPHTHMHVQHTSLCVQSHTQRAASADHPAPHPEPPTLAVLDSEPHATWLEILQLFQEGLVDAQAEGDVVTHPDEDDSGDDQDTGYDSDRYQAQHAQQQMYQQQQSNDTDSHEPRCSRSARHVGSIHPCSPTSLQYETEGPSFDDQKGPVGIPYEHDNEEEDNGDAAGATTGATTGARMHSIHSSSTIHQGIHIARSFAVDTSDEEEEQGDCVGSESNEYSREDAIMHVMMEDAWGRGFQVSSSSSDGSSVREVGDEQVDGTTDNQDDAESVYERSMADIALDHGPVDRGHVNQEAASMVDDHDDVQLDGVPPLTQSQDDTPPQQDPTYQPPIDPLPNYYTHEGTSEALRPFVRRMGGGHEGPRLPRRGVAPRRPTSTSTSSSRDTEVAVDSLLGTTVGSLVFGA